MSLYGLVIKTELSQCQTKLRSKLFFSILSTPKSKVVYCQGCQERIFGSGRVRKALEERACC